MLACGSILVLVAYLYWHTPPVIDVYSHVYSLTNQIFHIHTEKEGWKRTGQMKYASSYKYLSSCLHNNVMLT